MKIKSALITGMFLSGSFFNVGLAAEQQPVGQDTASLVSAVQKDVAPVVAEASPVTQDDVNELNTMSDPKSVANASDDMDDWFDTVKEKFHFNHFGEDNGKFIFNASQSVSLKPIDPQYGDALVNAFDKAMQKVQEEYLMLRFGKVINEKVRNFFSDRSTHAKDIPLPTADPSDYIKRILNVTDKGLTVIEKQLDNYLIKLGVDPDEILNMPLTKKKDIFRDKFLKTNIKRAFENSIAGLFSIQTNIIVDKAGRTVVGLVAIVSPKTEQIAKDISLHRKPLINGKGRNIISLLPETSEEYLGTFGTRLVYDQDGTPAILAYGIASYRPDTGDDYINDELKEEAKAAAVANADGMIAEIINGRMSAENTRRTGEEVRKYVEREMKANSDTIEKTIKNIIKITNRYAKNSARASLQGISTVKNWRYTTKEGVKFVGAVRVWKYSTLQAVNSFGKPKPATTLPGQKKHGFNTFQQESKPVNTMDDF